MGFDKREEEAVLRVIQSGILSEYQGNWSENFFGGENSEVVKLEQEWANYFQTEYAVACNSATSGLWMALNAIGLKSTDEVIVSPYTMTCSASLPLLFGATPVFADIEPDYFCIDPKSVEKKINCLTKAIIAVNIFGQPCDFDELRRIVAEKEAKFGTKIYIIEDNAQAPGAKYKGQYTGTLGDIGVFSLNRHKHIHCGEGGMVCTNDADLELQIRLSMNHAEAVINDFVRKRDMTGYITTMVGMNMRMPELSAAVARVQLTKLEDILSKHQEDSRFFPVKVRPNCTHVYYRYPVVDVYCEEQNYYDKDKFNSKDGYITPLYKMPLFKTLNYPQNQCPVCESVEKNIKLYWQKVPY